MKPTMPLSWPHSVFLLHRSTTTKISTWRRGWVIRETFANHWWRLMVMATERGSWKRIYIHYRLYSHFFWGYGKILRSSQTSAMLIYWVTFFFLLENRKIIIIYVLLHFPCVCIFFIVQETRKSNEKIFECSINNIYVLVMTAYYWEVVEGWNDTKKIKVSSSNLNFLIRKIKVLTLEWKISSAALAFWRKFSISIEN